MTNLFIILFLLSKMLKKKKSYRVTIFRVEPTSVNRHTVVVLDPARIVSDAI